MVELGSRPVLSENSAVLLMNGLESGFVWVWAFEDWQVFSNEW